MFVAYPARERRERVEEDAPRQHPAPAQTIREVAAEQAEDAAEDGRHEEKQTDPIGVCRGTRLRVNELAERRPTMSGSISSS